MNLTDPRQLGDLLKSFGFYTQKDLGQNFLIDDLALRDIVEAANIKADDRVLEIGPGPGVLTCELLKSAAQSVDVLEIDEKVIPILKHTTTEPEILTIHNVNALEFEPQEPGYIMAANIPYYLTSPIFRHFLGHKNKPKRAIVLVQKEVAEKICCKVNDQTILSLQIGIYGTAEIVSVVEKEKFFPAPKVDSAILKIEVFDIPKIPKNLLDTFWSVTKRAFSQKRKKIGNTIGKQKANKLKTFNEIFEAVGVDTDRRPQTLTIEEWKNICEQIHL